MCLFAPKIRRKQRAAAACFGGKCPYTVLHQVHIRCVCCGWFPTFLLVLNKAKLLINCIESLHKRHCSVIAVVPNPDRDDYSYEDLVCRHLVTSATPNSFLHSSVPWCFPNPTHHPTQNKIIFFHGHIWEQ